MPDPVAITAERLVFRHPGAERPAIDGVSLSVAPGERLAIVGPNGAGKSTLLSLLHGLDPPAQGRILIGGIAVEKRTLRRVREQVGFLFQSPDDQLFCPAIREDIAFGPRQFGWPPERVEEAVARVARDLDLAALLDHSPLRMSVGERQRAALATVLVLEPGALLLDEPTAALDPRRRRQLIERLRRWPQTMLVATHDLDLAWDLCPRAILLHRGRVAAEGETCALLADRALLGAHELEPPLSLTAAR